MHGSQILYNSRSLLLKRMFDVILSVTLVVLFSPVLFIICILIKLDSKGPILFKQYRVGRNLRQFRILKFRTMYHVSNEFNGERNGLIAGDIKESRMKYKTTEINDVRVTKLGKLLRKSHLDELPQLINVCLGSMSMIGPRPDVPAQEHDYKNKYWIARHRIKPGITGFSQLYICKNNNERLVRDLYYIKKSNIIMDFVIVFRTIAKILKFNSL
jgi:lipopolysaccharide/colanic/teichoic acid biosynthesis glycosyltransferase